MVSLTKCEDYAYEKVKAALKENIDLLGGLDKFVKPGQTVALKANLVIGKAPDVAATTHPCVMQAAAELCYEGGAKKVIICDSSGGLFTAGHMNGIFKVTGMKDAAEKSGAVLDSDFTYQEVSFPEAVFGKKMQIISTVMKADAVINITKLKSHSFTGYTGAVKNLFGVIPGLNKVSMHAVCPDLDSFCDFLIDIERFLKDKVTLHIIESVVAMEGNGPTAGNPKKIGKIIVSANAYQADLAALKLVDIPPKNMPLIVRALERNIITDDTINSLRTEGVDVNSCIVKDFKKVKLLNFKRIAFISFLPKFMRNMFSQHPKILHRKCKKCKKCIEHCPKEVMSLPKKKVKINLQNCIRCYCCQELCPFKAVKVKTPLLARIMRK